MSRGIKDLRELICVSRLTIRDSDDDVDYEGRISRAFSVMSTHDSETPGGKTSDNKSSVDNGQGGQGSAAALEVHNDVVDKVKCLAMNASDSGFNTNGLSPKVQVQKPTPYGNGMTNNKSKNKRKRKKKKPATAVVPAKHELPRASPLPSISRTNSDLSSRPSSSSASDDMESSLIETPNRSSQICDPDKGHYDSMLYYMDATAVSDWLTRANIMVNELTDWCLHGDHFVQFSHFWFQEFPDLQRRDLFELEHGIIVDEMSLAFSVGREARKVYQSDIFRLIEALFGEYPAKLLSSKGSHMFLDYLDTLTSERTGDYKKLLSNVKISTRNRQYAEWMLASRSFILVSLWSAAVNFYRRLQGYIPSYGDLPLPVKYAAKKDVYQLRSFQAIRNGYADVLHYLLQAEKISPDFKDDHDKSLVFMAATHGQVKVLQYLLNRVKPFPDVTTAAENGNTPLHAAANIGNVLVVQILLKTGKVDVNAANAQCDNATPLHLAVMLGHKEVTETLVNSGADPHLKMGDLSAVDIAKDFGHTDIDLLFQEK